MAASPGLAQVEVCGLPENLPDDFILLYFESRRRSGGGPIASLTRNGSQALLTFCNLCDAEGVLSRREHSVQDAVIQVRWPLPWDPRKVALCGLSPDTSESILDLYIENVSGRDSFTFVRSADKLAVLVTFVEALTDEEFQHLTTRVAKRLLHHTSVCARRVRVSGDILVENIGSQISPDLLEMYFESRRSGGGALQSVTMLPNSSAAIVSFCDWNVAQNVVSRTSHSLQSCQLSVSSFYPDLLGSPATERPGETLLEAFRESSGAKNMEQSGEKILEVPTEDPEIGEDLKVGGLEKTQCIEEGFREVQMDEIQHMRAEVQPANPEIQQSGAEIQQSGAEIQQSGAEIQQSGAEIQQSGAEIQQSGAEIQQSGAEIQQSGAEIQHMEDQSGIDAESWGPPPPEASVCDGVGAGRGAGDAPWPVQEAEVVMEAAELRFLQEYQHELLAAMEAVTIFPLDEDDKFGFKVAGDPTSCRTAVELLQHILSSLPSRMVTLDYPGVGHFLLGSEGQNTLHYTEQQHRCIIDTAQIPRPQHDITMCEPPDPRRIADDVMEWAAPPPEDPLLTADVENIKRIALLLQDEEKPDMAAQKELATCHTGSEEDVAAGESSRTALKDEELEQVCEMSWKEYRERQLDEDAQLLLAIQRSMDTHNVSTIEDEEEEMQRALEMSLRQPDSEETEESFQRVLELSLLERRASRKPPPAEAADGLARVRVLAADETSLVVACAALRKAVLSQVSTVSLEGAGDVPHMSHILAALERKHRVRVTTSGRQMQIQGFLRGPNQCRQELHQILDQARERPPPTMMRLDTERDVEMVTVLKDSDEYSRVLQPFLKTLQDVKLTIDVLQVQKVQNPLLYNQYQLKKQRLAMMDPNNPAERVLYHGTSEISAREICHHGFNRSFCGKNAVLYGQGVYFAAASELPTRDNYSPPNNEGKKFILVARVLTGEFTVGKADMRTPPLMPNSSGDLMRRYDSLVNSMHKPTIFVIFNDTQAYPEYLITCHNRRDTSR